MEWCGGRSVCQCACNQCTRAAPEEHHNLATLHCPLFLTGIRIITMRSIKWMVLMSIRRVTMTVSIGRLLMCARLFSRSMCLFEHLLSMALIQFSRRTPHYKKPLFFSSNGRFSRLSSANRHVFVFCNFIVMNKRAHLCPSSFEQSHDKCFTGPV